jgi:CRISPR/Cas system-associated protein Csm6
MTVIIDIDPKAAEILRRMRGRMAAEIKRQIAEFDRQTLFRQTRRPERYTAADILGTNGKRKNSKS